ncbi:MAG TPA: hypothetical protein VJL36_02425 [Candidatus Paceibacterota bacterium]
MFRLCRVWPLGFKEGDLAWYREQMVIILAFPPEIVGRGVVPVMRLLSPRLVKVVPADDLERLVISPFG